VWITAVAVLWVLAGPDELRPHMQRRRTDPVTVRTYADRTNGGVQDWPAAGPDRFAV
jgi:hypothetical protein